MYYIVKRTHRGKATYEGREEKNKSQVQMKNVDSAASKYTDRKDAEFIVDRSNQKLWYLCPDYAHICSIFEEALERRSSDGAVFRQGSPGLYSVAVFDWKDGDLVEVHDR